MKRIIPIMTELPRESRAGRRLTNWPLLGRALRQGWLMTTLRVFVLGLLGVAVVTGLRAEDARSGLSLLLMWGVFWPLFMVVITPTLGNAFCAVCPHGFVGKWLNRIGLRRRFPARLRGVWISLAMLVLGYWVIAFAMPGLLSSSTRATAWYFLIFTILAFGVFFIFKDMAWCKHVCPLGRLLASHGRVGVLHIETEQEECASCRSFECARACSYHLSPFRFAERNDMGACTLCSDCVTACDSAHLSLRAPGQGLRRPILGQDRHEAWIFVILLGVAGVGIQLLHGLGHSALQPYLPWVHAGHWLHERLPLETASFDLGRLLALLVGVLASVGVAAWAYTRVARRLVRPWLEVANTLACALAPLVLLALVPRALMRFATQSAHELVNHAGALFGLSWNMAPLAERGDVWIGWLNVLPYVGALWALWLLWQRAGLLVSAGSLRWRVWAYGGAPVWLYLAVVALKLAAPWLVGPEVSHLH